MTSQGPEPMFAGSPEALSRGGCLGLQALHWELGCSTAAHSEEQNVVPPHGAAGTLNPTLRLLADPPSHIDRL